MQSAANGGGFTDTILAIGFSVGVGWVGGAGYIPYIPKGFSMSTSYYTTEAIKAIKNGVEYGAEASGVTNGG